VTSALDTESEGVKCMKVENSWNYWRDRGFIIGCGTWKDVIISSNNIRNKLDLVCVFHNINWLNHYISGTALCTCIYFLSNLTKNRVLIVHVKRQRGL
jgi:hypothetical protein